MVCVSADVVRRVDTIGGLDEVCANGERQVIANGLEVHGVQAALWLFDDFVRSPVFFEHELIVFGITHQFVIASLAIDDVKAWAADQ